MSAHFLHVRDSDRAVGWKRCPELDDREFRKGRAVADGVRIDQIVVHALGENAERALNLRVTPRLSCPEGVGGGVETGDSADLADVV